MTFTKQDEDTAAAIGLDVYRPFWAAGITLSVIHASFGYPNCIQSAEAIAEVWPQLPRVREDKMLGNQSVFISDLGRAKVTWNTFGKSRIAEALLSGESVPGWSDDPSADARRLADHVLSASGAAGNAGPFVTHDIVIATTVRWMGRKAIAVENPPRAAVIHRTELR